MGKFFDYAFKGIPYEYEKKDFVHQSMEDIKYNDYSKRSKLAIKIDEIMGMNKNPYKATALKSTLMTSLSIGMFYIALYAAKAFGMSFDSAVNYLAKPLGVLIGICGTKTLNDIVSYIHAYIHGYDEIKTETYTSEEDMPEDLKNMLHQINEEENKERKL